MHWTLDVGLGACRQPEGQAACRCACTSVQSVVLVKYLPSAWLVPEVGRTPRALGPGGLGDVEPEFQAMEDPEDERFYEAVLSF